MAKTYPIKQLKVAYPRDMSEAAIYLPEGASQTFVAGSPVKFSSGFIVENAAPNTDAANRIVGFALEDGHNAGSAGDKHVKIMPVVDSTFIEVNYLAANGADANLASAQLGQILHLNKNTINGKVIWHASPNTGSKESLRCVSFKTTTLIPNSPEVEAQNGDTNARILCLVIDGANAWNA